MFSYVFSGIAGVLGIVLPFGILGLEFFFSLLIISFGNSSLVVFFFNSVVSKGSFPTFSAIASFLLLSTYGVLGKFLHPEGI